MNEIIKCKCGIVGIWNKTKEDVDSLIFSINFNIEEEKVLV